MFRPHLYLIKYFNKFLKYAVLYSFISTFISASAGSYEDFFKAIRIDEVKVVSNLLARGFDPNTVSLNAEPAILLCLVHDSLKTFELIAKHPKTQLNVRNSHSESALMLVSLKGHLQLAKLLVSRQADINHPGWTPLHYAATGGHVEIVQLLLDESAYIDAESPNGSTPLMMAARYGNAKTVQLLLNEGADFEVKNQLGLTALDFAIQGNRPDAIKLLESVMKLTGSDSNRQK